MRPVDDSFPVSQEFGGDATAGVAPNPDPNSGMGYYVYLYGNYQPYGHAGQDIACPIGTPIHAIADGTVIWAGWGEDLPGDDSWGPSGYFQRWAEYKYFPGILTLIQHDGWISEYGHQSSNDEVHVGMQVTEGQVIGKSGNTKTRTDTVAPHLHVGALVDLTYSTGNGLIYGRVDPTPYFGGISAESSTITPLTEGYLMALNDQDQQNIYEAQGRIDAGVAKLLDAVTAIQAATANIPLSILTAQFRTKAGAPIGVAAALGELLAAPATVTNVSAPAIDVDALVARLKAELPAAVLSELTTKLTQ